MAFINEGARSSVTALASATSAQNADRNGAALNTNQVHPGSLFVDLSVTIVTGSVVCTLRHQTSEDGSTWIDHAVENNAANVTITATATRRIPAPPGVSTARFYRCVATLSGAATAGGDLTAATYRFLRFGELE